VLSILTGTLSSSCELVDVALTRLFNVAESSDGSVSDEIRIHAMNSLKTLFLDAKLGDAVASGIERGFGVAIRSFWSEKYVLITPTPLGRLLKRPRALQLGCSQRQHVVVFCLGAAHFWTPPVKPQA
jgi:hypothetical protein